MDARKCMIVDLERAGDKRMFITEQVSSIVLNRNFLWSVSFSSSPRVFNYNRSRLLYLRHPEHIDLAEKGLYIDNVHITSVQELIRFSDGQHVFYHVIYENGYYANLEARHVYITRTRLDRIGQGSTWEYLLKLAEETGLLADDVNLLSHQYELVDRQRDNVPLAQYLGEAKELQTYPLPSQIFYPFGCNSSQKAAVEKALSHQVSIIQGPPGTGKTQTILNIISNLILAGKTVLVVSNNNSAVENVAEKLNKENLGFLVAQLGSMEHKEAFLNHQKDCPDMSSCILQHPDSTGKAAQDALAEVSEAFDAQVRQAELKAELNELSIEERYNAARHRDTDHISGLPLRNSAGYVKLLQSYKSAAEDGKAASFWLRLKWGLRLGWRMFSFLKYSPEQVIESLECAFYHARMKELEAELASVSTLLADKDMEKGLAALRENSLLFIKDAMARRYSKRVREKFSVMNYKGKTAAFLKEYPVVLSTTYSAKSCISRNRVFDYVIMDEASQVDIKTGALSLACAMNAVIVGDDKQLPNVVSAEEAKALRAVREVYKVDERYDAAKYSFLDSCIQIFKEAPVTLLREHYRCAPPIIEFCNKRFYDGELVTMTSGKADSKSLQVVRTVPGNHARGHFNQREIDVIVQEVMPEYSHSGTVGIITPYRLQAQEINNALGLDIASTVHKYQGRECDTIILSMVDNLPTEFSDDPNLLNVAISRAKKHLCVVTNGNEMPQDSILAELIAYIAYNNFQVKDSRIHSVFDLLYKQYTAERIEYAAHHKSISDQLSEKLIYDLLVKTLAANGPSNLQVLCHYPLSRLIMDRSLLDDEESAFVSSPFSHVDFLIYNSLTKKPVKAIEVDGWHFHRENEAQQSRDLLKDRIFLKYGLSLQRISTADTVNEIDL